MSSSFGGYDKRPFPKLESIESTFHPQAGHRHHAFLVQEPPSGAEGPCPFHGGDIVGVDLVVACLDVKDEELAPIARLQLVAASGGVGVAPVPRADLGQTVQFKVDPASFLRRLRKCELKERGIVMDLTEKLEAVASQDPWRRSEQARVLITEGLRSAEEAVRSLAAGLAAEKLDSGLAAELERLLDHDPADGIRALAVVALGSAFEEMGILDSWDGSEFSDAPMTRAQFRRIKRKLETIYRDAGAPEEIRRRALEALVRAPEAWHREAVSSHWSGDDPLWRATAVRCMGFVEDFDAQVLEALGSDSLDLKHAALWTLLDNPIEEAGDEILRLATSEQTPRELRFTTFEVLMALRPRGSLEALGPLLDSDDKEIAEAAGEAFAELAADQALDEEFEPNDFDPGDPMDDYGLYEGECAGCEAITRVDDMMMCEECAAKLDRDMIRQRDWDYSVTAWACPENRREELRSQVIREHGAKLELIALPTGAKESSNPRGGKKRKRRRKR